MPENLINVEMWRPLGSKRLLGTHSPEKCAGRACPVHNVSDHAMKTWPQNYRDDRGITERICPHGVGHPDPDDPSEDKSHGCDGCCSVLAICVTSDTIL